MPTVEDIALKLTKAEVFPVVDAKDRFLQVVLDDPSSDHILDPMWSLYMTANALWNQICTQGRKGPI